jgi:threonine aldolase
VEQLDGLVRPENDHMVRTRLLCLENTSNRGGGSVFPHAKVMAISRWAKHHGLMLHLDGARLFNASVASGTSLKELSDPFDSVSVCFSKGLGAPVGSCLVGSREFVARARRARKLFGGGMRQAGIIAAGALYALEHHIERLSEDHSHAKLLADAVRSVPGLQLLSDQVETNIVIFKIDNVLGTASNFASKLHDRGVQVLAFGPQSIRLVTHLDVNRPQIDQACEAITRVGKTVSTV